MRSIRWLTAVSAALSLITACGDGGGGTPPPENEPPVAGFSEVCTQLTCVFTDASTDPDGNNTIVSRNWAFGDNTSSIETSPTHVYAAGTYNVVLTVTDDQGATDDVSKSITVTAAPPQNQAPVANFTYVVTGNSVAFNGSTSTDADGNVATYAWNFGEPASGAANTSAEQNPTHTYAAVTQATPFTVTLTVTDDDGAASAAATQIVTIQPPAAALCSPTNPTGDGRPRVNCNLDVTQRATLTVTLTSRTCELGGNKFEIIQPIARTLFFNGCFIPAGTQFTPTASDGAPFVFEAGTQVTTRFTQGVLIDPSDPTPGLPEARIEGAFPEWTIRIDDGGAPAQPRNDDIVLTVTATVVQ